MSDTPKQNRNITARACTFALDRIAGWIAQNSATGIGRAAGEALERARLRAANLDVLDPHVNGEFALLRRLAARFPVRSVFDVGANVGEWSIAAAAAFPTATVHSFEPSPEAIAILEQRLASIGLGPPRVLAVPLALADSTGSRALHEYDESNLSSFVDWHGKPARTTVVGTDIGSAYAARVGIEAIDFVKIDVEGFEMDVLQGLAPLVRTQKIGFVQFEYGIFALERNIRLRNFFDFFGPDYRVGRLMPASVAFSEYDWRIEGPNFGNYVASRIDLFNLANGE